MKLFVIEGPDNTGKTRFSENLKNYFISKGVNPNRILYVHFVAPKANTNEECAKVSHAFSMKTAKEISYYNSHDT